jgi:subtilisin family serine protease
MTTDATSSTPEPPRPPAADIHPEQDYPDPRNALQRADDQGISADQSDVITDRGDNPHQRIEAMIESIQANRLAALDLEPEPENPPLQIDVLYHPGPPDQRDTILVASGEMLLRVPPGEPPVPGDGGADEPPPAWQRADSMLLARGYQQPRVDSPTPTVLPLRKYTISGRRADLLLQDRDEIRTATGAGLDLNYVVTAGHLVKADDYPRKTEAHRCYSPEWIRCHVVKRDVTVAVIDTGINHQNRTDGWLTGIPEGEENRDPLDVLPVHVDNGQVIHGDGRLDRSAGHGTFVAGVVQQVAPAATIVAYQAVDTDGLGTSENVAAMIVLAARKGADIINVSLGTLTMDDLPPLTFTTALDIVHDEHPDVLVVASAGNTGKDSPMFPAAMKGVIGVGALAANLTAAPFSNHGFWVDCSSVGIGIISTFVPGDEPPADVGAAVTDSFGPDAWAIWSGTSFSAPQIAGAVAQLCQMNDVRPAVALGHLLAGRPILPGYGHVIPILTGT